MPLEGSLIKFSFKVFRSFLIYILLSIALTVHPHFKSIQNTPVCLLDWRILPLTFCYEAAS